MSTDRSVVDDPTGQRFELRVDGAVAGFAAYRAGDPVVTLTHTEVDPAYEGQGLGSVLVRGALDQLGGRGAQVRPACPFVRSYIERHPDYLDLVPAADRERYGLPGD